MPVRAGRSAGRAGRIVAATRPSVRHRTVTEKPSRRLVRPLFSLPTQKPQREKTIVKLKSAVPALMLGLATQAEARDQIRIVGSSTVFPFATAVAEQFGRTSAFKTPVV